MTTNFTPNYPSFFCSICSFKTSNKKDYSRHILTAKHKNATNTTEILQKTPQNTPFFICNCGKEYKHNSSLWNHKKKCSTKKHEPNITDISRNPMNVEIIMELLQQNKHMIELMEKGVGNTTNSHNTTNKTKFNLNIFLNEQCKDAMNIMDFVDSLKLQLSDLEKVGELGYTKGISSIIVKALHNLDISKRPIHCSDVKRETIYVKDQNAWEKENDNKEKMTKMIKHVAHKNVKQIPEWQEENPEYKDGKSVVHEQFLKIVNESMGGYNEKEDVKNYNKIVKTIAKEIIIE